MKPSIRLIIADDHALFRQGLKSLFATYPEFRVVAEVERANELKQCLSRQSCDVLVLDLQMDRWVMEEIQWLARHAAVVVVTASEATKDTAAAIKLGARAVVQKRFALDTLIAAIRAAADGLIWLPPATETEFAERSGSLRSNPLTERELAIIRLVAEGLRNAEVAQRLTITEGTVKVHLNRIFNRLDIRDRVELTHYAIRTGLVEIGRLDRKP